MDHDCLLLSRHIVLGVRSFLCRKAQKRGEDDRQVSRRRRLCFAVFFFYPFAVAESGLYAIPFSLIQVMAAAVVASDPLAVFEVLSQNYAVSYLNAYKAILIGLHVIAPLFTIGITLSFFERKFAYAMYRLRCAFFPSHIFSGINERTLSIAENIRKNDGKCVILFAEDASGAEEDNEYVRRIKAMSAYAADIAPEAIRHSLRHTRTYYLMKADSAENLKDAVSLFAAYDKKNCDKIKLWLYSKDELSSVVIDNMDEDIDVRLINEEQLISVGLMQKYPLYRGDEKNLRFLLVGAGNIGQEILKTALWCSRRGQETETVFRVLDRNADSARAKLEKQCPGLIAKYHIIFRNADVETDSFAQALAEATPDYIVVALGSEQRNIRTELYLRRFYGFSPRIHVLTDHADTEEKIISELNVSDWHYSHEAEQFERRESVSLGLLPFGSYDETYGGLRFSDNFTDLLALSVNAVRFGIACVDERNDLKRLRNLLNKVEFYKNYSYAYAVSISYKLRIMGLAFVDDGKGDLSALEEALPEWEDVLVAQENERWCCYMRTQGWRELPVAEVRDGVYQDKVRKLHARLAPENVDRLSEAVGRDFRKEDRDNVYRLTSVIRLANSMTDRPYSVAKAVKTNRQ